jgi:hypothetical protein
MASPDGMNGVVAVQEVWKMVFRLWQRRPERSKVWLTRMSRWGKIVC